MSEKNQLRNIIESSVRDSCLLETDFESDQCKTWLRMKKLLDHLERKERQKKWLDLKNVEVSNKQPNTGKGNLFSP